MGALCFGEAKVGALHGNKLAKLLNMSASDVDDLYVKFSSLDSFHANTSSLADVVEGASNELLLRLILNSVLIKHTGESLTFEEFLVTMWNFLSLDTDNMAAHLFMIFDVDSTGHLDGEEVKHMAAVLMGVNENDKIQQFLVKVHPKAEMVLSRTDFIGKSRLHPLVLFPVEEMQANARERFLGARKWQKITQDRNNIFGTKTVFEILGEEENKLATLEETVERAAKTKEIPRNVAVGLKKSIDDRRLKRAEKGKHHHHHRKDGEHHQKNHVEEQDQHQPHFKQPYVIKAGSAHGGSITPLDPLAVVDALVPHGKTHAVHSAPPHASEHAKASHDNAAEGKRRHHSHIHHHHAH